MPRRGAKFRSIYILVKKIRKKVDLITILGKTKKILVFPGLRFGIIKLA